MTVSHSDENFDKELRIEKAVVLMKSLSLPDRYIIESKMYAIGYYEIFSMKFYFSESLTSL